MLLGGNTLHAANGGITLPKELVWIVYFIAFVMLILAFMLYRVSVELKRYKQGQSVSEEQKMWDNRTTWEKIFQLKPVGTDKDMQMDHDYDGITELDNPPPPWFMFLFYGTILFAVIYFIRFSVTGHGPTQLQEYTAEIDAYEASLQVDGASTEAVVEVDENTVELLTDVADLDKGKSVFNTNCKVCHGPDGKGTAAAPNLTDEYWLHGGGVKNVFKTVKYGVPEKGMVSWQKQLKSHEIQLVASYIISLQGSNPEGAWTPQGEIWVPETVEEPSLEANPETTETEAAPAE